MRHRLKVLLLFIVCLVQMKICQQQQEQSIVEHPSSQEAQLGDKVVFKCKIDSLVGEPQWCLDDFCLGISKDLTLKGRPRHRLVGNQHAGEYHLQIDHVQIQDHMAYYCMVTAASETNRAVKSRRAFLTVLTNPHLLQLNDPLHVTLNKPSTIQCIARKSRPPVNLLLSINGKILRDSSLYTKQIIQIPIAQSLDLSSIRSLNFKDQIKYFFYDTVINITLDDVSMFWQNKQVECLAYSSASEQSPLVMSARARIQVDYAPEVNLRVVSSNKFLRENEVVSLICDTKATPQVQSYKWYLGDNFLSSVSHDTLNLKLRREMNHQTVTCEAINSVASVKASSQLNVIYKPYFLKGTHSFIVIEQHACNRPLTLDCQVEANPLANITWFKLSEPRVKSLIGYGPKYTIASLNCGNIRVGSYNESLSKDENYDIDDNDNTWHKTTSDQGDFGLYYCEASNGLSEASAHDDNKLIISKRQIKLNPLGEPIVNAIDENSNRFSMQLTKTALLGTSLLLTCLIEPLPKYKNVIWLRDSSIYIQNSLYNTNENDLMGDDETNTMFTNVHVKYENSSEGLKSYLYVKLNEKKDFGVYKCKAWNKYGSREVSFVIREASNLLSFDQSSNFFKNYLPHFLMSLFILLLFILFAITILVCYFKRRRLLHLNEDKDKELLSKEDQTSDSKTINEWLATSSKLSNHTTLSVSQPCVIVDESSSSSPPPSTTTSPTKQKLSTNETDKKSLYLNSLLRNDSDEDLNRIIQDTTYRLSDLFKDLSPASSQQQQQQQQNSPLLKIDSPFPIPTAGMSGDNTLKRGGTSTFLYRPSSNPMSKSSTTLLPTQQTSQYMTRIHSNMKKIPFTTMSKHYNGTVVKAKNPSSLFDDCTSTSKIEIQNDTSLNAINNTKRVSTTNDNLQTNV